jgi:hypothetical protein
MLRYLLALSALCLSSYVTASAADGLCAPLRKFVESVKPDDTKILKFHTSWGSNFKDSDVESLWAKRCEHDNYKPAKSVCTYLMEHGATEFSGNNAKAAVTCLSSKTQFAPRTQLDAISLSLMYGTENRGDNVDVEYTDDKELGGMVLSITVRAY